MTDKAKFTITIKGANKWGWNANETDDTIIETDDFQEAMRELHEAMWEFSGYKVMFVRRKD